MEIEFLNYLNKETLDNNIDKQFKVKGISLNQIEVLEKLYNNSKPFPKALRELLFLGGDSCYLLNRLWYENQQEIQKATREWLLEYNITIAKPFFVIDVHNIGESFSYVYLDDEQNPTVYHTVILTKSNKITLRNLNKTLSTYIDYLIDLSKRDKTHLFYFQN